MKKIVLFAAAMLICAGISFAQEPVKKPAAKAQTEKNAPVKADAKTETPAATKQAGCGNCPHHKQCDKKTQTAAKPETTQKSCCSKDAKQPAAKCKTTEAKAEVKK